MATSPRTMNFFVDGEPGALITVTETGTGALEFTVEVKDEIASASDKKDIADLRGLFFHVSDESLLDKLKITPTNSTPITSSQIGANAVTKVTNDVTMSGRTPSEYDIGIEFGTQGIGKDDIRKATFILDYVPGGSVADEPLSLEFVAEQFFGVRLTSVSNNGVGRELSLKLVGKSSAPTKPGGDPGGDPGGEVPAGGSYDDLIEGGSGDDEIHGGRGNDEIQGEGGDDFVEGGTDNGRIIWNDDDTAVSIEIGDNLYGNDGADTFYYGKGDGVDLIWDFQPGRDIIDASEYSLADITVSYVQGVTNRIGTSSHKKITIFFGQDEGAIVLNDFPNPGSGAAIKFADGVLTSAQLLALAEASATGTGGPLSPTATNVTTSTLAGLEKFGTNGSEWLAGAAGNDRLYGNEGTNLLQGLGGDDALYGGNGRDIELGGDGNDNLYGNEGDDLLIGGAGNDKIYGTGGADVIYGDEEDDAVIFTGGAGDNLFEITHASDVVNELAGGGYDTALVSAASFALDKKAEVEVLQSAVKSTSVDVLLVGSNTNNLIIGHLGKDTLRGLGGNDVIKSSAGADELDGGAGNDILSGGSGRDFLIGGLGRDVLRGDSGADVFDFNSVLESQAGATRDVVHFNRDDRDKVDLSGIDAIAATTGTNDSFTWIGSGAFSGTAGQLRYSQGLLQADVNGDKVVDLEIKIVASVFGVNDIIL